MDSVSEPAFLSELQGVDRIRIGGLTLDDSQDVSRFIEVCRNARWAPFVSTMPGNVATVEFISGDTTTHQLLYGGGWLIENRGEATPRFGTIRVDDSDWIDQNIDYKLMMLRNAM